MKLFLAKVRRSISDLPASVRQLRSINLLLAIFAVLTVLTWWVGDADWQYSTGKELAFDRPFPASASDWNISGAENSILHDGRTITLAAPGNEQQSRARKRFDLPATRSSWQRSLPDRIWRRVFGNDRLLRVRSVVETLQPPGELEGRARHARIAAWLIDDNSGSKPFRFATVANLDGSQPRYQINTVLAVPGKTDAIELVLMSLESNGQFRMRHLEARLVKRTLPYRIALTLGIAGWVGLFTALGLTLVKRAGWLLSGMVALALSAILIGVMLPETVRLEPLRRVFAALTSGADEQSTTSFVYVYKAGHFLFFTLATFVVLINRWRLGLRRWQVFIFFVLLAAATEGFQLHLYDRSTRGTDVLVDIAGVGLAFLLGLLLASSGLHGRRRRRSEVREDDEIGDERPRSETLDAERLGADASAKAVDENTDEDALAREAPEQVKKPPVTEEAFDQVDDALTQSSDLEEDESGHIDAADPDESGEDGDDKDTDKDTDEGKDALDDQSPSKGERRRRKKHRGRRFRF